MQWILDMLAAHSMAAADGWHQYRAQRDAQWDLLSRLHGRNNIVERPQTRLAYTAVGIIVTVGGFVLANFVRHTP